MRKNDFFGENYLKCWKYLKESQNFIYFVIGLFSFFVLIGFFVPAPESVSNFVLRLIEDLIEKTKDKSAFGLIWFIFQNNVLSSFFGFVGGFFLGIYTFFSIILNGYLIGYVSSLAVSSSGFSALFLLVPHGIFELPAIFISLGLGLKFSSFIFQKNKEFAFRTFLFEGLRVFLFVIVPLLIIAAIIEGSLMAFGV